MTDIFSLKVEDVASKIKDAQLTSVEVCQKYIERINQFEKDVKAWVHFDKKLLLEKAEDADEHRRAGKPTGPLHGIPIALKDIIGTVDMPTECGTPIRKGKSYSQNAEIVDLLTSAGAIIMGKTATSELAYLGPSKTTNPYDHERTPGGSSSGSAASVASFMAPLSIGSQTGGSIIRPASYCGVVGYKPSYGLISRNGVLKTSYALDHIGMFGRSVEDVAILAKVLIKKDHHDPATIYYSAENILEETKKGPAYEPKFIFYKSDYWKIIEKKSRESFEYFIKSFKNIEVFELLVNYFPVEILLSEDPLGVSPMTFIAYQGGSNAIECAEILMKRINDPVLINQNNSEVLDCGPVNDNGVYPTNALCIASAFGDVQLVKFLIGNGVPYDANDGIGRTAYEVSNHFLHNQPFEGSSETVLFLHQCGEMFLPNVCPLLI